MIIKCSALDEKQLFSYIGDNYSSCLYLYLNMLKYGIESDFVSVYIHTDAHEVKAIMLKYYSCLHVFSQDKSFNDSEIANFFITNHFTMLYCVVEIAERIYSALPQDIKNNAIITEGWVAKIEKVDSTPQGLAVAATNQDFKQIVELIYDDEDIGRSYRIDELAMQLEERNKQGYSRNLVIKQDNLVIAHACTNAELDRIAVVAELLVREEYRKKGYASEIWRDICSRLLSEGKEVYSFYYSEESRRLHRHIGFFEVCRWAKVVIPQG